MSHTPGPWKVDADDKPPQRLFYIRDSFGRKIAQYLAYDDHVAWPHTKAEPEHVAGNAALLAAAPLLLAACQKARAAYDHNVHAADIVCALEAALPSIEAAICAALPEPAKGEQDQ